MMGQAASAFHTHRSTGYVIFFFLFHSTFPVCGESVAPLIQKKYIYIYRERIQLTLQTLWYKKNQ